MTAGSQAQVRWPGWRGWLLFAAQLLVIEILDAANDVARGDLIPPSVHAAVANAHQVIRFETVHGFFVEPGLYRYFLSTHHLFGIALTHQLTVDDLANNVYAFLHIGVPILVAGWVFVRRRERFGLLRNVLIVTGILAFVGYLVYPVAPPRLTPGIVYQGRPFSFHDTMPYPKSALLVNGRPLGYNPYAAMPSLHIAWATIFSVTLLLLSRSVLIRLLALIYPIVMLLAIVITANHYIMDGVGGVITVLVAALLILAVGRGVKLLRSRRAGMARTPTLRRGSGDRRPAGRSRS